MFLNFALSPSRRHNKIDPQTNCRLLNNLLLFVQWINFTQCSFTTRFCVLTGLDNLKTKEEAVDFCNNCEVMSRDEPRRTLRGAERRTDYNNIRR